jgi:hypothetical protein
MLASMKLAALPISCDYCGLNFNANGAAHTKILTFTLSYRNMKCSTTDIVNSFDDEINGRVLPHKRQQIKKPG